MEGLQRFLHRKGVTKESQISASLRKRPASIEFYRGASFLKVQVERDRDRNHENDEDLVVNLVNDSKVYPRNNTNG